MTVQRLDRVYICYRISDPAGDYKIFDDAGSLILPGRWNSQELPVLYTSEHYSTAMLEKLAGGMGNAPCNQHFTAITLDSGLSYEAVTKDYLPGWDTMRPSVSREYGSQWLRELRSALLIVPSYVAHIERNILINLRHPEARNIAVTLPEPVGWGEWLLQRTD